MIDIGEIKLLCRKRALRWTDHVLVRLIQRSIDTDDVVYALQNGEIIEQYPTDYPYPSCLVLGVVLNNNFIHVVCAQCGETSYNNEVAKQLERIVDSLKKSITEIAVVNYTDKVA